MKQLALSGPLSFASVRIVCGKCLMIFTRSKLPAKVVLTVVAHASVAPARERMVMILARRLVLLSIVQAAFAASTAFAQAALPAAPAPSPVQVASTSSVPSLKDLGLPSLQQQAAQATGQKQAPAAPAAPPKDNGLSLSDLGFSTAQTQTNPHEQALLEKRTHMLKVHQTLGLITAVPLYATVLVSGGAKQKKGPNGTFTEPSSANVDLHAALGSLTAGLYGATAYYAIFAPKIPGVKPKGAIKLHRDLAYIHFPGMILTPILGSMALSQESKGEKVHGIASAHAAVAATTVVAYTAAIVAVSWPIHWKFWEH